MTLVQVRRLGDLRIRPQLSIFVSGSYKPGVKKRGGHYCAENALAIIEGYIFQ
jgi:hypothetical protein